MSLSLPARGSWPSGADVDDAHQAPGDEHEGVSWRLGAHLLLAALPLLAISAHVFGLVPMHLSAGLVVVPLLVAVAVATGFRPVPADRVLLHAAVVGAVATAVYDTIRLDTVYLLGWWGDFIPRIGAWILHTDDPVTGLVPNPGLVEVVVGYVWRYVGDGGGIGIWFFIVAAAIGLRERGPAITIAGAVTFAVAPVWAGLIATVAIAPRASELMFPLTTRTLLLSLLGHLIFGVVLGLGVMRTDGIEKLWPWARVQVLDRALDWVQGGPSLHQRARDNHQLAVGLGALPPGRVTAGGWSEAVGLARARSGRGGGAYTDLLPPTLPPAERAAEVTQLVGAERLTLPPAPPSPLSPPYGVPALRPAAPADLGAGRATAPREHPSNPPRPAAVVRLEAPSGPTPQATARSTPPRGRPTPPTPIPVPGLPCRASAPSGPIPTSPAGTAGAPSGPIPLPPRRITDPKPTTLTSGLRVPVPGAQPGSPTSSTPSTSPPTSRPPASNAASTGVRAPRS